MLQEGADGEAVGEKLRETHISASGVDVPDLQLNFLVFDPDLSLTFHIGHSGFSSILDAPLKWEERIRENWELHWKGLR